MKRYYSLFLFLLILCCFAQAQDEQAKINEIKKSLNFIYATGTSMTSADEAYQNAKDLLSDEIDQWLKNVVSGDYSGYVAKAKNNVSSISTKRGNLMRSFVYVKKTDILPLTNDETVMMVSKEAVSVDTLAIPTTPAASHDEIVVSYVTAQALPVFHPTTAEEEMLAISNLSGINSYIAQGSGNGKISAYGKYDANTRLLGKSYFFLINKEGTVIAVLRKVGSEMISLATGNEANISDYGRCGVIWFQLNEK